LSHFEAYTAAVMAVNEVDMRRKKFADEEKIMKKKATKKK
jgi:hypothetical protein